MAQIEPIALRLRPWSKRNISPSCRAAPTQASKPGRAHNQRIGSPPERSALRGPRGTHLESRGATRRRFRPRPVRASAPAIARCGDVRRRIPPHAMRRMWARHTTPAGDFPQRPDAGPRMLCCRERQLCRDRPCRQAPPNATRLRRVRVRRAECNRPSCCSSSRCLSGWLASPVIISIWAAVSDNGQRRPSRIRISAVTLIACSGKAVHCARSTRCVPTSESPSPCTSESKNQAGTPQRRAGDGLHDVVRAEKRNGGLRHAARFQFAEYGCIAHELALEVRRLPRSVRS